MEYVSKEYSLIIKDALKMKNWMKVRPIQLKWEFNQL
jgi:hypothetical protein